MQQLVALVAVAGLVVGGLLGGGVIDGEQSEAPATPELAASGTAPVTDEEEASPEPGPTKPKRSQQEQAGGGSAANTEPAPTKPKRSQQGKPKRSQQKQAGAGGASSTNAFCRVTGRLERTGRRIRALLRRAERVAPASIRRDVATLATAARRGGGFAERGPRPQEVGAPKQRVSKFEKRSC